MANTLKNPDNNVNKSDRPKHTNIGVFALLSQTFNMDGVFEQGVPLKYLPKIIWITLLIILYIANAHYTEKTIRKIDKLKYEVEDLRTDFTTLKASYMYESKQSEVARKVTPLGLEESKNPPLVLELK